MKAYVTASIRYTSKMVDKADKTSIWSQVSVGNTRPLALHEFLYALMTSALTFYTDTAGCQMPAEEINAEMDKARKLIDGLRFLEEDDGYDE